MHFLIGTTNIPKSEAIEYVLRSSPHLTKELNISKYKVNSGVPDMPLSLQDIRNGAKNRAKALREISSIADYYVGMEWGVYKDIEWEEYWLIGIVYIENQEWIGHYGYSCHLEVPKKVISWLFDWSNRDLEEIMHTLWGEENIWDKLGSYHAWTDGILDRKQQFIMATQCAISPFFNHFYKK